METMHEVEEQPRSGVSRRGFIKGVIATGGAVSSVNYLFRGKASAAGAMGARMVTLNVNGRT